MVKEEESDQELCNVPMTVAHDKGRKSKATKGPTNDLKGLHYEIIHYME